MSLVLKSLFGEWVRDRETGIERSSVNSAEVYVFFKAVIVDTVKHAKRAKPLNSRSLNTVTLKYIP